MITIHKKNNPILINITILRVIAIILVVLGHSLRNMEAPNLHLFFPHYTSEIEVFIKSYIYSFHMPLFFFISGYIFYFINTKKEKNYSISIELKKKFQRLIIPLYATSFLVLLPTMFIFGNQNISILKQSISMLQMSSNDHLWFLKALFLIFILIIPIFSYIKKQKIFTLIMVVGLTILLYVNSPLNISFLSIVFKYLPYFILGMVTYKLNFNLTKKTYLFIGLFLLIIHFISFSILNNSYYINNKYIIYILAILGIYAYYFLATYISHLKIPSSIWKKILILDNNSFSIYLFHVVVLYIILYYIIIAILQLKIIGSELLVFLSLAYLYQYTYKRFYQKTNSHHFFFRLNIIQ